MIHTEGVSTPCRICSLPLERYRFGPDKRYVRAYRLDSLRKLTCHACYMHRKRAERSPKKLKPSHAQKLSMARNARAYALHLQGRTIAAIAKQLKTSHKQISRRLRAHEAIVQRKLLARASDRTVLS